ncbi:hypothetical protein CapIbe_023795 [Capra ibex]
MSIGYERRFSGHNLGPGVVDLGAGLVEPGSVRWEGSPGFCGSEGGTHGVTECLNTPDWRPPLTPYPA